MLKEAKNQSQMTDDGVIDFAIPDESLAQMHPFYCVQQHIYDRIRGTGGIEPRQIGRVYLSLENLEYVFYELLRRFTEETGDIVMPENQSMQDYAEMMFENYYGMLDSFDEILSPTPAEIVTYVLAWNKNSVDYMLVRATRGYNRQQNYVRRYNDYKYGALPIEPIKLNSKKTQRTEINMLQNWKAIGSKLGRPLYPCRD